MKRIVILICCMLCALMAGCAWMGQTAGKAQAKIERKAQDLEQGYNKGYEEEKSKGGSQRNTPNASETSQTSI